MKKIIYFMFLAFALVMTGCENKLEEEFQNPNEIDPKPEEKIPGMLTEMLDTRFFKLDYGEWYWNYGGGFGVPAYAQIAVRRPRPNESSYYSVWSDLSGAGEFYPNMEASKRFNYYYTNLKNFGLMRDEIEVLAGDDLANNELFFLAATVIKDAIGLQIVDNFDKIPFSEAFLGTKGVFFPKYDDGKEIYTTVLDELAAIASRMPEVYSSMSESAKASFALQDIAFKGDAQKWVQYINSVRLRHAVRISGVDAETAKKHIAEVISNLPATDFIFPNTQKNENVLSGSGGGIYARALYEQAYATLIPNVIMQRMNYGDLDYVEGEDDPRLPVIAGPTRYSKTNWQYNGCSMDYDALYPYWSTISDVTDPGGPGLTFMTFVNYPSSIQLWVNSCYSQYNIATFTFGELPAYMTSRAENDLFLAEVALKGLGTTGKTAADHIRDAVINSTDYWYQINAYSTFFENKAGGTDSLKRIFKPTKPTDDLIGQFADKIKAEFEAATGEENKMEIIMQQKYIHFNILGIYELWTELRRTRHPRLEKLKVNGTTHSPIPERIKYPTTELQYNSESYYKVIAEDNFTGPIFWVPDSKKSESYYMDGYLPMKGYLPLPDPNPNR